MAITANIGGTIETHNEDGTVTSEALIVYGVENSEDIAKLFAAWGFEDDEEQDHEGGDDFALEDYMDDRF